MKVLKTGEEQDPGYVFEEVAEEEAANRGQIVKFPSRNELFIDIDNTFQLEMFNRRFNDLFHIPNKLFDDAKVTETPSRSGFPHLHIIVSLTMNGRKIKLTDWERVALQFALGSDPVKEALTVYRILAEVENPSILFEDPQL